jgi:hypothetical protein
MIIVWVAATVADVTLALTSCCPFTVTAGLALVILAGSMTCELLRARRERPAVKAKAPGEPSPQAAGEAAGWTGQDEAILSGDLSMAAWERAGQLPRDGAR